MDGGVGGYIEMPVCARAGCTNAERDVEAHKTPARLSSSPEPLVDESLNTKKKTCVYHLRTHFFGHLGRKH